MLHGVITDSLFRVMSWISSYSAASSAACCLGGLYTVPIVSLLRLLVCSSRQTESYISESCFFFFFNFHGRERVLDVTDDAAAFLVKPVLEETFVTRDRIFRQ